MYQPQLVVQHKSSEERKKERKKSNGRVKKASAYTLIPSFSPHFQENQEEKALLLLLLQSCPKQIVAVSYTRSCKYHANEACPYLSPRAPSSWGKMHRGGRVTREKKGKEEDSRGQSQSEPQKVTTLERDSSRAKWKAISGLFL